MPDCCSYTEPISLNVGNEVGLRCRSGDREGFGLTLSLR